MFQGDTTQSIKLPQPAKSIESAWNNGLVITTQKSRYHVNTDSGTILPITLSGTVQQWVQEKYLLTYSDRTHKLTLTDITTNQQSWSEIVSPSLTTMMVSKRDILLHYSPSHNELISFMSAKRQRNAISLPKGALLNFYRAPDSFSYIIDNLLIYQPTPLTHGH